MTCRTPEFNPHHYNLDLPLHAKRRDIQRAYRRFNRVLHPDKIKDPDQRANAFAAILLINEAYEVLIDEEKRVQYQLEWNRDVLSTNKWEVIYWDIMRQKKHIKNKDFDLKPWFWHYDPIPIGVCNGDVEETPFCTATWVNLAHIFVDNFLPTTVSDNIWRRALIWRGDASNMTGKKLETLDFQRGCENFQVNITMEEANLRWSEIPSLTDLQSFGERCELFCPDIILFIGPFVISIFLSILSTILLLCVVILRWFIMPNSFTFWPESAITSHWEDRLPDVIITQSRRKPPVKPSQQEGSSQPTDEGYYADEEITTRDTSEPQHTSEPQYASEPQHTSDTGPQSQFYSAVATADPSTRPSVGTLGRSTESSAIVGTQNRSVRSLEKSSPTQYYSADSEAQESAVHPSQLLSLRSSERHWYYSDPNRDSAQDLPLRERRKPFAPPEKLRPRYVHYDDEDYADDERTPRLCAAITASGKPCQRRVSMTSPLTGSTISGLVSPLCFQHRNLRTWIRKNNDQEPLTPGRTPSAANSPVLEKRKLSRKKQQAK
ncbi:hypothetical protein EYC84_003882 [Monilinia fructicola]|uniref:J domain-containing protein n=1 Tax=Monilinia fructicola TaxID=38448 RepID=A0A5M9JZH0_MONFR|nr:hypothetical protein EYC84_003882 [Monilinia fructicola]